MPQQTTIMNTPLHKRHVIDLITPEGRGGRVKKQATGEARREHYAFEMLLKDFVIEEMPKKEKPSVN